MGTEKVNHNGSPQYEDMVVDDTDDPLDASHGVARRRLARRLFGVSSSCI